MPTLPLKPSIPSIPFPSAAPRALMTGAACAILALTGCGPELADGEPQAEREIVAHTPEILGEFETRDGVKLTFSVEYEHLDGSGEPVVAITELAPLRASSFLARLNEQKATPLEGFLAVAPEGTEAPAVLRAEHERAAARLGRSAEVREFSASGVSAMDGYSSATCNSYAAFTTSLASWLSEQSASSTDNHSLTFHSGGNVQASMCNYHSDRVDYKYAQFCHEVTVQGSELGLLYCEAKLLIPDGYRINKGWFNATTDRLVRSEKLENYTLSVSSFIAIGGIPPVP
jgi:hypothetical protein